MGFETNLGAEFDSSVQQSQQKSIVSESSNHINKSPTCSFLPQSNLGSDLNKIPSNSLCKSPITSLVDPTCIVNNSEETCKKKDLNKDNNLNWVHDINVEFNSQASTEKPLLGQTVFSTNNNTNNLHYCKEEEEKNQLVTNKDFIVACAENLTQRETNKVTNNTLESCRLLKEEDNHTISDYNNLLEKTSIKRKKSEDSSTSKSSLEDSNNHRSQNSYRSLATSILQQVFEADIPSADEENDSDFEAVEESSDDDEDDEGDDSNNTNDNSSESLSESEIVCDNIINKSERQIHSSSLLTFPKSSSSLSSETNHEIQDSILLRTGKAIQPQHTFYNNSPVVSDPPPQGGYSLTKKRGRSPLPANTNHYSETIIAEEAAVATTASLIVPPSLSQQQQHHQHQQNSPCLTATLMDTSSNSDFDPASNPAVLEDNSIVNNAVNNVKNSTARSNINPYNTTDNETGGVQCTVTTEQHRREGATPSPDRKKMRGVVDAVTHQHNNDCATSLEPAKSVSKVSIAATRTPTFSTGMQQQQQQEANVNEIKSRRLTEGPLTRKASQENDDSNFGEDDADASSNSSDSSDEAEESNSLWLATGAAEQSPEKARSDKLFSSHQLAKPLKQQQLHVSSSAQDFSECRHLPPPRPNEIEFVIEDFLNIRCNPSSPTKLYSQPKVFNSVSFRILVFPKGNHGDRISALKDLSAYVAVDPSHFLPSKFKTKWCMQRCEYQLIVINWKNWREKSILKSEQYTFMADDPDRGWRDLVPAEGLKIGEFLGPNGQLVIRAQIVPRSVDASNHSFQGRQEIGYIGIRNQGATCYLNSLVQALFHIGKFRKSVFELTLESDRGFVADLQNRSLTQFGTAKGADLSLMTEAKNSFIDSSSIQTDDNGEERVNELGQCPWSTEEIRQAFENEPKRGEGGSRDVALALQALFFKLTTSNEVVTTDDLIKSFGWQSNESLTQHDAQELNRLLCDRLEEQMKGTPSEGAIEHLFMGEFENYVECLDVPYGSCRREKFYDLQLGVQDMKDMYESLKNYTAEEILEGDNLYDAEHFGRQRARKGVRFIRFPPVIQFHLKRFTFDPTHMDMVKVNQRFEYPEKLDLSKVLPGAGTYDLFCVIVHAGDVGGGHYYVINRPEGKKWWMKFDDEKVYPVAPHAALADSYGGCDGLCWNYLQCYDNPNYRAESTVTKLHSAYILFYVKSDFSHELLTAPEPDEINPYLSVRQSREEEQEKRRLQIQRYVQRYVNVRYISEHSLRGYQGFLNDIHTVPAFHEQRFSNEVPIFNLWKAIHQGVQNRELNDPLLLEMQNNYFHGLWYFDGTISNRMTGRAADVRPLPCHLSESSRRQYSLGDHLGWIARSLRIPWKPTVSVLVHPLFIREKAKIRSVPALASAILDMRIFIAKIFNPGCKELRRSEEQVLVIAGIPLLKFDKDRRQSPVPILLTELARTMVDNSNLHFNDRDVQEFVIQQQNLFSPSSRITFEEVVGLYSCYLEEGASFEPLPSTTAAFVERLEASRHSRVEEPCPIIVFSLPPSPEAIQLRDAAEAYGMGPGAEDFYENEENIELEDSKSDEAGEDIDDKMIRPIQSSWEAPPSDSSSNVKLPDCADPNIRLSQQSEVMTQRAFFGKPTLRQSRRRYPPKLPRFISCNPIDWHRALTRSKISVLLKLYDPLAVLGRWEDAGGHPLFVEGDLKCSLSAGSLFESATPTESAADTTSGSGIPEVPSGTDIRITSVNTTSNSLSVINGQQAVRCPPIKEKRVEVDLRWPYALAIKRLCWMLGESEESCLVMTGPPLLGDALAFSYRSPPSSVLPEETIGWNMNPSRPHTELIKRLDELHSLLAQKQNQPRYRDITLPPEQLFISDTHYHFSLLPRPVNSSCLGLKGVCTDRDISRAVLVRIFNSKVENVGCILVEVEVAKPPTVQEFIQLAQSKFSAEMTGRGAPESGPCRLLWVGSLSVEMGGVCNQLSQIPNRLEILNDESFRLRLSFLVRGFQFDTPLRIEPDFTEAQLKDLAVSESLPVIKSLEDQITVPRALRVLVLHQNGERQYFGHPFFTIVSSCDTLKTMKEKINARLELSYSSFSKWKFFAFDFEHTSFVRDDEVPDFSGGRSYCLLAVHKNLYATEDRARTLQLHIK